MRSIVKFGELYDITSSKRVFEKDWKKSWVPFYRAREIVKLSENWYVDNELFISEEMYKDYWKKYWLPQKNDIMVTWVWTIWVCYLVKDNDKFYFKDWNILWFKNKWKNINPYYVEYFFKTDLLKNQIQNFWSVVQTLTIQKAKEVEIPLPPLETQKAIVAKLDQIFAELDQTKSEIQKNLDNTDELWKSALNQAFQGDWGMKKLGEVCDVRDWTHESPKYYEEWIPFITSKNLKDYWIDFDNVNYISREDHISFSERSKVEVWDILFAMIWTIWNPTIVSDSREFSIKNVALIKFGWKENILNTFVRYLLDSDFTIQNLTVNSRWWTQKFIALKDIRNFMIPVPPLSEQEKIVEHLDQVSKEVKALKSQYQSQLDNLEELKKSVLDKAFRWELGE